MAKTKKSTPNEDEAQSKRFLDLASELEAAGDLSPAESEGEFERLVRIAAPRREKAK